MPTLLVVDDEPNVLYSIEKTFRSEDLTVLISPTGRQGLELVRERQPDAVILDVRLSDMSGLDVFDRIRQLDPRLPVIIVTAFATTETAIEAIKRGAFEYLLKPLDLHQLGQVIDRAIDLGRLRHVPAHIADEHPDDHADLIVGRSARMQDVYKTIGRVAAQDVTVLVCGESGTGKELVVRAIYHHGHRSQAPLLTINCAAIPENLLESELFGHERGAFTGADHRRIGKFEQADGGTLFLDEIGDMSLSIQAKLLRLLQEQRFERLGGNETIQTDVRIIAATNKNLEAEVAAGRFRPDLYYRLNAFQILLPPLEDRREDIPLLVDYFIRHLGRQFGRNVRHIAPDALQCLLTAPWPGNVRQLQGVIKYGLIKSVGEVMTLENLPEDIRSGEKSVPQAPTLESLDVAELTLRHLRAGDSDIYRLVTREVDKIILETVLNHVKNNQVQASELLGISRTTLRARIRELGITSDRPTNSAED